MANDRELQNILNSGEVTSIFIGGQAVGNKLLTSDEIEALPIIENLEKLTKYQQSTDCCITVAGDTYEDLLTLDVTDMEADGIYELRMSMLYSLDNTTRSAYFRFSIDNGATWVEVAKEPKDTTDLTPMNYWKVVTGISGTMNIIIQGRKENVVDVLYIQEISVSATRKA